ncbi:MAG: hypothetical protein ACTSWN_00785 [Promethearchaeota archaeon]
MRPPICAICQERFDPEKGGLVYFRLRKSDEEWHERAERLHLVGHPPEAEWFCEKHINRARELSDLTIDKAFQILKAESQ